MVLVKRIKIYLVFVCTMLIFVFGSSVYSYALAVEENNSTVSQNYDQGDWLLSDNYDRKGYRYENFLRQKDSLHILEQVYHKLQTINGIDYYEFSNQDFIYTKKFFGSKKFINGEGNQNIDGMLITPLKSIQISELFAGKQKLDRNIHTGSFFDSASYKKTSSQVIPIVAGADYQYVFKLNSTIENFYLATQNIQCRIIGFLDKNTRVKIDGESINLDHYLIMPDINLAAQDNRDFKQTLLSVKCNGYLHYNNKKEYHQMAQEIKKIVKETGYQYLIPPEEMYNLYHLSIGQIFLIFLFSAFALLLAAKKLYRDQLDKAGNGILHIAFKTLATYLGWLFSSYAISQGILLALYKDNQNLFTRTRPTTILFLLTIGCFLTLLSVIYWKKEREA